MYMYRDGTNKEGTSEKEGDDEEKEITLGPRSRGGALHSVCVCVFACDDDAMTGRREEMKNNGWTRVNINNGSSPSSSRARLN